MPDVPRVHTGEPLVRLSDDEIAYRASRGKWTLTEALFHLSGHKPPGYESIHHLQDHFWPAYHRAEDAILMGKLCRKIKQAGETVFIDSPANWFAWADSVGPECITVDERVRRAVQGRQTGENSSSPKTATPPTKKRVGGRKRGPYFYKLKRHLKWRKDNRKDIHSVSLKELCQDARSRLIMDQVRGLSIHSLDAQRRGPAHSLLFALPRSLSRLSWAIGRMPKGTQPVVICDLPKRGGGLPWNHANS